MTLYLTPFVLIGGLVVLGLTVGVALVLLTMLRERADVGATRDTVGEHVWQPIEPTGEIPHVETQRLTFRITRLR